LLLACLAIVAGSLMAGLGRGRAVVDKSVAVEG
jgi:hypothetical protein